MELQSATVRELNQTQKPLTKAEYKKAMNAYWTIRHSIVKACGHKFDHNPLVTPKHRNCDECWLAYFNTNGEQTQIAEECLAKEGPEILEKIKGKQYVKRLYWFLAIVATFVKAGDDKSTSSTEGISTTGTTGTTDNQSNTDNEGRSLETNNPTQ